MKIYCDSRWEGGHGIGRFAFEVSKRIPYFFHIDKSRFPPTHPIDLVTNSFWMLFHPNSIQFTPGYNSPLICLDRFILTLHDLNHIDLDANSSALKRFYYSWVLRPACRRAARVLTVSEFSRQRIIEWAGVPPGQVVNVSNGVDATFNVNVTPWAPGYPYLLCVSNRKLHKNEQRLIKGFASAGIDQTIKLVLTGEPIPQLQNYIRDLGVDERVIFSGRISEHDLPGVYKGALATVFPSLYEGFGLPVIESMACGTPVITSNVTALPEVAGDAALLVDPLDESAIAHAIERIVSDQDLRHGLVIKGIRHANNFSWDSVAQRVSDVLIAVIKERERSR